MNYSFKRLRQDTHICEFCREKIGGGLISLVTHAVIAHDWRIKLVLDNAKLVKDDE